MSESGRRRVLCAYQYYSNCRKFYQTSLYDDVSHFHHFRNFDKLKYFAGVCDIVERLKLGREDDAKRILVYNIGISIHDIHFAASIYEMIQQKGILALLPEAEVKSLIEKF